eukprot:FR738313.1.p1 GENE.FR738313.1~~FR738313.1.p1  ORF type:complete len:132 (+),score=3.29 FR738313.1:30-398(+)
MVELTFFNSREEAASLRAANGVEDKIQVSDEIMTCQVSLCVSLVETGVGGKTSTFPISGSPCTLQFDISPSLSKEKGQKGSAVNLVALAKDDAASAAPGGAANSRKSPAIDHTNLRRTNSTS